MSQAFDKPCPPFYSSSIRSADEDRQGRSLAIRDNAAKRRAKMSATGFLLLHLAISVAK